MNDHTDQSPWVCQQCRQPWPDGKIECRVCGAPFRVASDANLVRLHEGPNSPDEIISELLSLHYTGTPMESVTLKTLGRMQARAMQFLADARNCRKATLSLEIAEWLREHKLIH